MTQSNTQTVDWFALDLDSLDISMDKVHAHFVDPQQGAVTNKELFALPTLTAICGYAFPPKVDLGMRFKTDPILCPKCRSLWGSR